MKTISMNFRVLFNALKVPALFLLFNFLLFFLISFVFVELFGMGSVKAQVFGMASNIMTLILLAFILPYTRIYIEEEKQKDFRVNIKIFFLSFLLILCFRILIDPLLQSFYLENHFSQDSEVRGSGMYWILLILSSLVISPIFEELLFRRYLFSILNRKNNLIFSVLVSSACYSIIHISDSLQIVITFLLGVLLSYVFFKTKRIEIVIFMHFIFNLFWFLSVPVTGFSSVIRGYAFSPIYWLVILFGGVFFFISIYKFSRVRSYIRSE